MPRFDLAIMNPPYDGSLHLKILEKVISIVIDKEHPEKSGEIINISPINHVQNNLLRVNKKTKAIFDVAKIDSIKLINSSIGNSMFGLSSVGSDLGIWKLGSGKTDPTTLYKHIIENYDIVLKVLNKVKEDIDSGKLSKTRTYLEKVGKEYSLKFVDGLSLKNNGGQGFSSYSCVSRNYSTAIKNERVSIHLRYINFKSEEERRNAFESYTCQFMRWFQKDVAQGGPDYEIIPYMQDYSKPWTNERFCKYFNITGFISDTEAETNSEWEEILKTMCKYS